MSHRSYSACRALLPLACGLLCACATLPSSSAQTASADTGEADVPTVWIHLVEPVEPTGEDGDAVAAKPVRGPLAAAARRRQPGVFGCGDRLVALAVPLPGATEETAPPRAAPDADAAPASAGERITTALEAQLAAAREETPPGLLDALRRTSLRVVRVEPSFTGDDVEWETPPAGDAAASDAPSPAGVFRVVLSGRLELGGVCDVPRLRAQLTATATQFDDVDEVELYLGDEPLDAVLSQRGLAAGQ